MNRNDAAARGVSRTQATAAAAARRSDDGDSGDARVVRDAQGPSSARDRVLNGLPDDDVAASSSWPVALWVPNVIGYVRVALLVAAFGPRLHATQPAKFLCLYLSSIALDFCDGFLARQLRQQSELGAFLDVSVDLLSRALLYAEVLPTLGAAIIVFEALTFASNHRLGKHWKAAVLGGRAPRLVTSVLRNGLRQPLGALIMAGLFLTPVHLYIRQSWPSLQRSLPFRLVGVTLVFARLLCALVELWCLSRHAVFLVSLDRKLTWPTASPPPVHASDGAEQGVAEDIGHA